jgi:hypothetical protein
MAQQQPKDYTQRFQKGNGNAGGNNQQSQGSNRQQRFKRSMPDQTIHHPAGFMFFLGGMGVFFGAATNIWQMFTTFSAMWDIMNPQGSRVDQRNQPMKFAIAAIIAVGSQLGLMMLTFKIDTRWKHNMTGATSTKSEAAKGYAATAIEVVQHVDLISAWGLLSFVIDTIGDFVFVSGILQGIGAIPQIFITALYAIFLYSLSTIAFARSVEYIWSGLAATAKYVAQQQNRHHHH